MDPEQTAIDNADTGTGGLAGAAGGTNTVSEARAAAAEAEAALEAEQDRILDEQLGPNDDDEAESGDTESDDAEEDAEVEQTEETDSDTGDDKGSEQSESKFTEEDTEKAVTALKRAKFPQDYIDQQLKENPDALVELGLERAEWLAGQDGLGNENIKLKEKLDGQKQTSAEDDQQTDGVGETTEPVVTANLAELFEPLAEELDVDPKKLAGSMEKFATSVRTSTISEFAEEVGPVMKKMADLLKSQGAALDSQVAKVAALESSAARSSVQAKFPQVEDDAVWAEVQEKSGAFAPDAHPSAQARLEDAARLVTAGSTEAKAKATKQHKSRTAGQPSTRASGKRQKVKMTIEDAALQAVVDEGLSGPAVQARAEELVAAQQ